MTTCCRVSHGIRSYRLIWEGSLVATRPRFWTLPPFTGGLWSRYASCRSRPRLPAREGSGAAMRPTALDPTSHSGGLRRRHVSNHYSWGTNKEVFGYNG
jgi:hypothetical protein